MRSVFGQLATRGRVVARGSFVSLRSSNWSSSFSAHTVTSRRCLSSSESGLEKSGLPTWQPSEEHEDLGDEPREVNREEFESRMAQFAEAALTSVQTQPARWNSVEIETTVMAFANGEFRAPALFESLAHIVEARLETFSPKELSNTAWAYSSLGVVNQGKLYAAFATQATEKVADLSAKDRANLCFAFANANFVATKFFEVAAEEARTDIASYNSEDLSATLWAYATAGVPNSEKLFDTAGRAIRTRLADLKCQDIASIAWSYSTLGIKDDDLMTELAKLSIPIAERFDPQELSNASWAFSTAEIPEQLTLDLYEAFSHSAAEKLGGFQARHLANLAWGFTTAGVAAPELFKHIVTCVLENKDMLAEDSFEPSDIANLVWAFAQMGILSEPMFKELRLQAEQRILDFEPHHLSTMAWAYTTAQYKTPVLFSAIASVACRKIDRFEPHELSILAWACATAEFGDPEASVRLFTEIAKTAIPRCKELGPSDLANLAWAYSTAGIGSDPLFEAIARSCAPPSDLVENMRACDLANMAWAYTRSGIVSDDLFELIAEAALVKFEDFTPQEVAKVAWAFEMAQVDHPRLLERLHKAAEELDLFNTAYSDAEVKAKEIKEAETKAIKDSQKKQR